jgi:hypothetical protein
VVTGIGSDEAGLGEQRMFIIQCRAHGLDHGNQQFLFAAGAVRLRIDDDLVSGIDGSDTGVALDDTFAGRHLGRLVVGAVALADRALAALAVFGMGSQPLTESRGVRLQAGDALDFFLAEVGFGGFLVCFAMAFEHDAGSGFEFDGLVFEVGTGAALLLAGVARQFDVVDGEHLAPDQPLAVAQIEDLGEEAGDVVREAGNESGNRGEVGLGVARQGDEGDVVAAHALNATAGYDALAVGEQNDLQEHGGRIGGRAGFVVVEPGIEAG